MKITAGKVIFNVTWNENLRKMENNSPLHCQIKWKNKIHTVSIAFPPSPRDGRSARF
jgi:hypothetical protein